MEFSVTPPSSSGPALLPRFRHTHTRTRTPGRPECYPLFIYAPHHDLFSTSTSEPAGVLSGLGFLLVSFRGNHRRACPSSSSCTPYYLAALHHQHHNYHPPSPAATVGYYIVLLNATPPQHTTQLQQSNFPPTPTPLPASKTCTLCSNNLISRTVFFTPFYQSPFLVPSSLFISWRCSFFVFCSLSSRSQSLSSSILVLSLCLCLLHMSHFSGGDTTPLLYHIIISTIHLSSCLVLVPNHVHHPTRSIPKSSPKKSPPNLNSEVILYKYSVSL